uniref:eukaryotic translation initiation factor 3 subunit G n=1 Tax=Lonchura striata TaxID=40157 RepID=UPI000B4CA33E
MPAGDYDSKPSWADQVEEEGGEDGPGPAAPFLSHCTEPPRGRFAAAAMAPLLGNRFPPCPAGSDARGPEAARGASRPAPPEVARAGRKCRAAFPIIRTFRIETRKASKAVARRKNWKKFGNSEFDAPGPNVATTTVSDDVFMTFITSKEDLNCQEEEDPMNKLKGQKIVSCRICKGDHWTTRCPYKDTLGPMQKELAEQLGLSTGEKEKLPGGGTPNPKSQIFLGIFPVFARLWSPKVILVVPLLLWWPRAEGTAGAVHGREGEAARRWDPKPQ